MLVLQTLVGFILGAATSFIFWWIIFIARETDTEAEFRELQRALKEARHDN